jgi:hypothetical protein
MTAKRKLKRRVRERQARTGESYVTARRRVLAAKAASSLSRSAAVPGPADETFETTLGEPALSVPVVQLHDISSDAARLGFQCKIAMFPALGEVCERASVLAGLRDALIRSPGDPATVALFATAFGVPLVGPQSRPPVLPPRLQRRLMELGIGGWGSAMVVFRAVGRDGSVPVLCLPRKAGLVLAVIDSEMEREIASEDRVRGTARAALQVGDWVRVTDGPFASFPGTVEDVSTSEHKVTVSLSMFGRTASIALEIRQLDKIEPKLFVVHEDRHYAVTTDEFIIGSTPGAADFVIRDGMISRRHAAVIRRNGVYYITDLGSKNGIFYKGMRIDNKRIDEGDVFQLGDRELRFTYRADG